MKNLMLKGIRQILKLLDAGGRDSHEEQPADSQPGREDKPAQGSMMIPACSEPTITNPSPSNRADPVPDPRRIETSISDGLREQTLACAFLRKSVESEMAELCRTYRSSMPPCSLQLFAWGYPKGSPPRVLYWVRLSKKQRVFDDSLVPIPNKRPRWFKVLKIRTRGDLHGAIHWNGLDRHRRTVMSFYDRWWALNNSHSLLARAMQYSKMALDFHLGPPCPGNDVLDFLMKHDLRHLEGPGVGMFVMAWQMGRLVERNLFALEELQERTTGLPVRLVLAPGPTEFDRAVEWEHQLSGQRWRTLLDRSLNTLKLSPQDLAAIQGVASECKELMQSLSKRLGIIRGAESRLAKAHRESTQVLEQCTPVECIPWIPGS